ncbi:MAG TPA: ParB/RepB/Spo0J family partition protein [Verrucomicrobiota bacterium]|nr:ParB/RepB/Spo0J family partition protein [Verrucomicrobiota bacterium]
MSALLGGQSAVPAAPAGAAPPGPAAEDSTGMVRRVPLADIVPSPLQPRKDFPPEALAELADSIRAQGILNPLVVRARGGRYELIAGERRWRAAQLAGLAELPVLVREADDPTALELMLVENLQREGLNPLDEAQGFAELMARFGLTQEQAAQKVGRSRAGVANALRLLRLPAEVQGWVRDGRLSAGHAKVILGLPGDDAQLRAARTVLDQGLNVRQTEALVGAAQAAPPPPAAPAPARSAAVRDVHVAALEARLRERLGTKVGLHYRKGRGRIDIQFFSDDELERLLTLLGVPAD